MEVGTCLPGVFRPRCPHVSQTPDPHVWCLCSQGLAASSIYPAHAGPTMDWTLSNTRLLDHSLLSGWPSLSRDPIPCVPGTKSLDQLWGACVKPWRHPSDQKLAASSPGCRGCRANAEAPCALGFTCSKRHPTGQDGVGMGCRKPSSGSKLRQQVSGPRYPRGEHERRCPLPGGTPWTLW